ncbi:MAG: hypothetical protein KAY24_04965 [Candidatus Eisenbacteria sp.]|nr:hypothetical protein [Candidatus Eisenbacteria bacterium]
MRGLIGGSAVTTLTVVLTMSVASFVPSGATGMEVWDSGWIPFPEDPPFEVWVEHGLGYDDPGSFIVDLKFRGFEGSGIHNNGEGGLYDWTSGQTQGGYFSELDAYQIKITRYEDDVPVGGSPHAEFRVIIQVPQCIPTAAPEPPESAEAGLIQNSPNPLSGPTSIHFSLADRTRASLRIFDVSGRLVKTLADGEIAAGRHQITWDGTDTYGRMVSEGVYYYELGANGVTQARNMVILR